MAAGLSGEATRRANISTDGVAAGSRLLLFIGPVIVRGKVNRASASPAIQVAQPPRTGQLRGLLDPEVLQAREETLARVRLVRGFRG
jgi:hypothetical protein